MFNKAHILILGFAFQVQIAIEVPRKKTFFFFSRKLDDLNPVHPSLS